MRPKTKAEWVKRFSDITRIEGAEWEIWERVMRCKRMEEVFGYDIDWENLKKANTKHNEEKHRELMEWYNGLRRSRYDKRRHAYT